MDPVEGKKMIGIHLEDILQKQFASVRKPCANGHQEHATEDTNPFHRLKSMTKTTGTNSLGCPIAPLH